MALHALHVHFQRGKKHDIVESHASEEFKTVVTHKDVESVLSHNHAGKHHPDDVRNAELAHDDGGKKNDQQHHEKNQGGVGDGKIGAQVQHILRF